MTLSIATDNMIRTRYILLSLLLLSAVVHSQNKCSVNYFTELNAIMSKGDYAPFWLTANRQGLSSVDKANGYARAGLSLTGDFAAGKYHYKAVADVVGGYNQTTNLALHQLYGELSWRWLTLSVGQKECFGEMSALSVIDNGAQFGDNRVTALFPNLYNNRFYSLGSGAQGYSGNSRPIPQVRIEIPEYINFPWTKEWVKVRAHIAYGMFMDGGFQEDFSAGNRNTRYTKNVLYHSKAFFVKVGKPERFPITFEGGLEMYSQFGGDVYKHGEGKTLSMPNGVEDFFKALIPMSGSDETPTPEQSNISGNQVGNWHFALTLHTKPVDVRLYGQHMFEDFSQLFFVEYQSDINGDRNIIYYPWKDIMVGVNVKNKSSFLPFISNVNYEYIATYNQSGAGYNDPGPHFTEQMDGVDDYYNHSIYAGWHNYGMGIGNPLVLSPLYNRNGSLRFAGNRLKAHHVGVNGAVGEKLPFVYRLMYTYSENWGTYYNPFNNKKYTTSLVADVGFAPKKSKWMATLSFAYDKSNWIGENLGVMFSVARVGIFK